MGCRACVVIGVYLAVEGEAEAEVLQVGGKGGGVICNTHIAQRKQPPPLRIHTTTGRATAERSLSDESQCRRLERMEVSWSQRGSGGFGLSEVRLSPSLAKAPAGTRRVISHT